MKKNPLILIILIFIFSCNSSSESVPANIDTSPVVSYKPVETTPSNESNSHSVEDAPKLDCSNNIRAYEFGREMGTWSQLRGGGSLQRCLSEYADGLGLQPPFSADDPCVITGFDDQKNGVPSPFNKEGKSWSSF